MLKGYYCELGMSLALQMKGLFKWPFDLKATKKKSRIVPGDLRNSGSWNSNSGFPSSLSSYGVLGLL